MKTMTVGEFKARFSEVLEAVKKGQEIAVSYGKSHKPIGVFKPFEPGVKKRKLGILKGKANFIVQNDFKITEQELLG